MRTVLSLLSLFFGIVAASTVSAQSASLLSHALEGTTVTAKIDMPATKDGVEVKPLSGTPIDYSALARSIKSNGIGVHRGESMMVTKVAVKEHHIEFQLGGGGYGTFGDILSDSSNQAPVVPYEYKSRREKDLETELRYTYNSRDRREIKDELHREQSDRARDNALAAAVNAQSQQAARAVQGEHRAQGGSRLNVRYNDGIPPEALTPQGLMRALSPYLDFDRAVFGLGGALPPPTPASFAQGSAAIRKGLTIAQVEQVLGPAADVNQRNEGGMTTSLRQYDSLDGQRVSATFVGGVLVDYSIRPR